MPVDRLTVGKLREVIKDLPDDMKVTITGSNQYTYFVDGNSLYVQNFDGSPDTTPLDDVELEEILTEWIEEDGPEYEEEYKASFEKNYKKVLAFYSRC